MKKYRVIIIVIILVIISISFFKVIDDNSKDRLSNIDENIDYIGNIIFPDINYKDEIYYGESNLDSYNIIQDSRYGDFGNGEKNIVLAGHREVIGKYLKQLKKSDIIQVEANNKVYKYQISNILIVDDDNVKPLEETGKEQLIVYTCYPFKKWQSFDQRYIIIADPI